MSDTVIDIAGVSKAFGGNVAVNDVTLQVARHRLTGIIGPNGAGKTTLLNLVTCLYRPTQGRITVDGHDIGTLQPHALARLGVTRTFQNLQIFGRMSVLENVVVAAQAKFMRRIGTSWLPTPRIRRLEAEWRERALAMLAQVGLDAAAERPAADLPYGMLKRLELARALTLEPTCLLLDEPAAGCNPTEANELVDVIRRFAEKGVTVVLVEHNMKMVMALCEHIFVLDRGRLLFAGPPAAVQTNPAVIAAYLGSPGARMTDADA